VEVFQVILEGDLDGEESVWHEMQSSEETLKAFLCGVRAGAYMASGAYIPDPEIPPSAIVLETSLPEEEEKEMEQGRLTN
jgi:hypothetical protein